MATEITSKDKLPSPWLRTISKPASHPKVVPKAEAPRPKPNTKLLRPSISGQ